MHFALVSPVPIQRNDQGLFGFEPKILTGVRSYAAAWKGQVTVLSEPSPVETSGSSTAWVHSASEEFDIRIEPSLSAWVQQAKPDVVLALHRLDQEYIELLDTTSPIVLTSEVSLKIRMDIMNTATSGLLDRIRPQLGLLRREHSLRKMARKAAGIQCNGYAAWNEYSDLSSSAIIYQDHRIFSNDLALAEDQAPWDGTGPLNLGFSGRLTAIKGPAYFVRLGNELVQSHPDVRLHIMGSGELEPELRRQAGPNVIFHGSLDFESEWKSHVLNEIDLMVLPHVQGDPSCTYFESMGLGVPIIGFDNETLTPLVQRHGVGWTVPRGDVTGLARFVRNVRSNPGMLASARRASLDFMATRSYEQVVETRMAHLAEVARAHRSVRVGT